MDCEKAFDRVWFEGLIYKLDAIHTPIYITRIINSFLHDRTFQVAVQNQLSDIHTLHFGLPQGATVSPILYNVYTCDQPTLENSTIQLFADDSALSVSSRFAKQITSKLKKDTKKYSTYLKNWKIKTNEEKFQLMFFTRRRTKQLPSGPLNINNVDINWCNEAKYLGLILDKTLTFQKHIEYALNKANTAMRIFYSLLNRRSKLNLENKLLIYKVAIRPIFSYGCQIFNGAAKTHIDKLQRFQNKVLRAIFNVTWNPDTMRYSLTTSQLHLQAELETVKEHFDRLLQSHVLGIAP